MHKNYKYMQTHDINRRQYIVKKNKNCNKIKPKQIKTDIKLYIDLQDNNKERHKQT